MKNISVIGLGKLGACMAAVYASKGFNVIGVDLNQNYVNAINNKEAPVNEIGLDELIKKNSSRLKATTDYEEAILGTEKTAIIVPTPTDETGGFSCGYVIASCKEIGKALAKKKDYHLVVVVSTMLPGDSKEKIIPILEEYSGKKCGPDFGYCYSPEFVAIGSVIRDLSNPDVYLIGQFDEKSGKLLKDFYYKIRDNEAEAEIMNIPSAELAKISLNSYVTMKITFANALAEIADLIPGADSTKILKMLGRDKRIGSYYLKSGLGFGGPCFPRDNVAFSAMAKRYGGIAPIAEIVHEYNEKMAGRISDLVKKNLSQNKAIGFLGLSYKPGTPVVEESHIMKIVKSLCGDNCKIFVYEPAGYEHAKKELLNKVVYCQNIEECLENSDIYFLGNMEKEFEQLENFVRGKNKTIIDPWGIFKDSKFEDSVNYISIGLE